MPSPRYASFVQRVTLRWAAAATLSWLPPGASAQETASSLAPWLKLPPDWSTEVQNGVIAAVPGDLPPGASLLVLIEPIRTAAGHIEDDFQSAVSDLGTWTPSADPEDLDPGHGWIYRLGVGVTELEGTPYTALAAVARSDTLRARFWVIADNDDTYMRYQSAWADAITSVQRTTMAAGAPAAPLPEPVLDPTFGEGVSGVYVGIDRGLSASAGIGGIATTVDPVTGRLGAAQTATAPTMQLSVGDFESLIIFMPDGSYRYGLPYRGFRGDLAWDRRTITSRWGTWSESGDQVVVDRGGNAYPHTRGEGVLFDGRGRPWTKIDLPGPMLLEGIFVRDDFQDPDAPALVLRRDGTYEDIGGFIRMVTTGLALVVPDGDLLFGADLERAMATPSTGAYTFDKLTLELRAADGRIWQIATYVPEGESPDDPARLVVNTRRLVRR